MSGFTIDRICQQAGISRGLINHHFKTKDELLLRIYDRMTEHLVLAPTSIEPTTQLQEIIDASFDDNTFEKSNLRAWLAIWGQVATEQSLRSLHEQRYGEYKKRISACLRKIAKANSLDVNVGSVARQFIALIDGLWLEYCLHSHSFSLKTARRDCYAFLNASFGETWAEEVTSSK